MMNQNTNSLGTIVMPDGTNMIVDNAFGRCTELTSIKIPNSVKEIRKGAFVECRGLDTIAIGYCKDFFSSIRLNTYFDCRI